MRRVETVTEPDIDGSVSISSYSLGKLVLKIPQSWLYSYMKRVTVRAIRGMKRFIKFTTIWISQNLAIPFWMVGHIHLSTNVYQDLYEIITSIGLNLVVFAGFIMDYKLNTKANG